MRAKIYSGPIVQSDRAWTGECECGWAFWGWDWRTAYAQTCKHLRHRHVR